MSNKPHVLERKIEPEGNEVRYVYDGRDNVTETRAVAKPGSGLADIASTAAYPASCDNRKTCNKPTSVTDARGNSTDFTYDPTHGGVLTETAPAAPDGVRPQTRYTYQQRHAWVKDASGAFVRAADPVWVLVQTSVCTRGSASGSGCALGDEVRTTYDYGPDSGPNNLLPRGRVVDADRLNLRTCTAYDASGNQISETSPNAGLSSCQ